MASPLVAAIATSSASSTLALRRAARQRARGRLHEAPDSSRNAQRLLQSIAGRHEATAHAATAAEEVCEQGHTYERADKREAHRWKALAGETEGGSTTNKPGKQQPWDLVGANRSEQQDQQITASVHMKQRLKVEKQ